jgi:hypothetical protein
MLARVVGECWHALARDVLALGYRTEDMFTELTLADMVSIVEGAPPTSSVRHFLDGGWSRTDHLLANWQEGQSGLAHLEQPYQRPGLEDRDPIIKTFRADSMEWDEFDRLQALRAAVVGESHVRTI